MSLLFNAGFLVIGWLVLPHAVRVWLFGAAPGPAGFAVVLETWLLSDVTATNLLGRDPQHALDALQRPGGIRHLVRSKVAALAMLIGPLCAGVGLAEAGWAGNLLAGLTLTPMLLSAPFGALAVTSWLGAVLPYRCQTIRARWAMSGFWRRSWRWILAVALSWWLGPATMTVLLAPVVAVVVAINGRGGEPVTTNGLLWVAGMAFAVGTAAFFVGTRLTDHLVLLRRAHFTSVLGDPVQQ